MCVVCCCRCCACSERRRGISLARDRQEKAERRGCTLLVCGVFRDEKNLGMSELSVRNAGLLQVRMCAERKKGG